MSVSVVAATTFVITHSPSRFNRRDALTCLGKAGTAPWTMSAKSVLGEPFLGPMVLLVVSVLGATQPAVGQWWWSKPAERRISSSRWSRCRKEPERFSSEVDTDSL